ncbi:hypothetical protein ACN20G_35550 (plasmid) [Streptomyces sp. BI20]|uniref:hypothetical protein n=1 Tax=Streptomyces sp. BI20 TaxID=3403460 RepID=UPI003C716423
MSWMALAGAVVGALIATVSAVLLDRGRRRWEREVRLADVRRALYGEYLACLSRARNEFRALARDRAMGAAERERGARVGFAPCYEVRYQMSITAAPAVVVASEEAFRRLRDVRDLAASGVLVEDEAYVAGRVAYEAALARLRAAMRGDLGADRGVGRV